MAKTIVGLFDNFNEAQEVVQDLVDGGFERKNISIVANDAKGEYAKMGAKGQDTGDNAAEGAGTGAVGGTVVGGVLGLLVGIGALAIPGIGPILAAGPLAAALGSTALGAGIGAAAGGLVGALVGAGVPEEDANFYSEGVRRGGTLVTVNAGDDMAQDAYDIMQRHGAVDIDERGAQWKQSGWNKFDDKAKPYGKDEIETYRTQTTTAANRPMAARTDTNTTTNRNMNQGETVLPIVEEELQVGKREVQRGGVRVYTTVEEKPVEAQVTLHEEKVNVERRPVNRPVSDTDMAAFKEGSFEMTETSEEAVISKQARVVEEVVVNKEGRDRTETVRDTVRRSDVEVEQLSGQPRTTGTTTNNTTETMGFDSYNTDFRNHYQTNFAKSGMDYNQYSQVYRYGYDLAGDKRYTNQDWSQVEPEARQQWESRNPNTWEQFKDAVRYGWDKVRSTAGNAVGRADDKFNQRSY